MLRSNPTKTNTRVHPRPVSPSSTRQHNRIGEMATTRLQGRKRKAVESQRTEEPTTRRTSNKRIKVQARTQSANRDDHVTVVYDLRSRQVVVPNTGEPYVPSGIPSGRNPFALTYVTGFSGGDSAYSSQTLTCAKLGLEHYNSMNKGDEHELVEAVNSNAFSYIGIWMHVNFLAKPKGATGCDLVPRFFAEVRGNQKGNFDCASCVKMDPGLLPTESGCEVCPPQIMHPAPMLN
ncbi:hypothetical protein EJB05_10433 [Eragrostis curvula]|uniref:DUF3615 domain-containing protein n=1 Tax=Eragrostis curvula TaxID=38414 RepID=A0A5J9VNR4_9POAL|nr:hypothetical protein EJB05_10433 [Eragrostis curvula]